LQHRNRARRVVLDVDDGDVDDIGRVLALLVGVRAEPQRE
jgi:hypothetical protein